MSGSGGTGVHIPYLTIVVPAYNEEPRLARSMREMRGYLETRSYTWCVIVVDDGSTDRTAAVVREFGRRDPRFICISYGENRGKGYALRRGIEETTAEWILISDADLATPLHEVERLFETRAPIAIGSRALEESRLVVRQPRWRELLGRTFNRFVQCAAVPGIRDTQCGFKLFRGDIARELFRRSSLDGYGYDVEVLYEAHRLGYTIAEIPVRWAHREGSKVSVISDGVRMACDVVRMRLRRR